MTALHYAADRGYLEMCELLISRGIDVDSVDEQLQTPLMYAAICDQYVSYNIMRLKKKTKFYLCRTKNI